MYIQLACRQPAFVLMDEDKPVVDERVGGVVAFLDPVRAQQEAERLGRAAVAEMTLGEFLLNCEADMRCLQMPDGRVGQVGIFVEVETQGLRTR